MLILAAGSSSRLGRPKQLEKVQGISLIRKAAQTCLDAGFKDVNVVLGYEHEKMAEELSGLPVEILINQNWRQGVGNSLSFGLRSARLKGSASASGVLIYLADQPFISSDHLKTLWKEFTSSGKKIVCSGYSETFGPPLIADRSFFPELEQLNGDAGAKNIVKKFLNTTKIISFNPAAIDIDNDNDARLL